MVLQWFLVWQTIGTNGFAMVFGTATIDTDGFEVRQLSDTMVFQLFPMAANHWSNDGMVTIHRYGLIWANGQRHGAQNLGNLEVSSM